MVVYDNHDFTSFEIDGALLGRWGVVNIVRKIAGAVLVRSPKRFSRFREHEFCVFDLDGCRFWVEEEEIGGRYSVGPRSVASRQTLETVRQAFVQARPIFGLPNARFPVRTRTKAAIVGVAVVATLAGVFIRPYEGSLFIVTKGRWHDVIGMAQASITRATRDCHTVASLARSSGDWQRIKAHLGKATGGWASPLQVLHEGSWYLVESEFENAEPAIVLIEGSQNGLAERASWGGNPGPFLLEPVMWAHLHKAAPQAPNSLIQCFEKTELVSQSIDATKPNPSVKPTSTSYQPGLTFGRRLCQTTGNDD